jgi:uncharacterized protein YndB with AHSA1/START domain
MSTRVLTFEQIIQTNPEQVCYAFTNASALRNWLCDIATVDPRPGGRMYLAWNSGYYASGEYTTVEPGKGVAFVWYGRDDPNRSQVMVSCEEQENGVKVVLEHALPEEGQDWTRTIQEIEQGWHDSLENLASVLETGEDMRFTRRPMLGINLNDFTPEHAKQLGVPVTYGIRIDDVVDGLGAQAAGLQGNDVLVGLAGREIHTYSDLTTALMGKRAGDRVPVEIYRGPQKMTMQMTLSQRPLPEIPGTLKELVSRVRHTQGKILDTINEFFKEVSEADASFKPGGDEWSIKETLAHLIHGERDFQRFVEEVVGGQERWSDDYTGNLDAAVRATVDAYPGMNELIDELKRAYHESANLFAFMPSEVLKRKGAYWRLAATALETPYHFYTHLEQMKQALEASRQHSQ